MTIRRKLQGSVLVLFAFMFIFAQNTYAAGIGAGNLLISTNEILQEYTRMGTLVQSFKIPYPTGPHPSTL